jgi:ribosomal subunit interface protein
VVVRKVRGQWSVNVNADAFPRLRINSLYAQILSRQRGSGLAGQLQEARWLIKNVQQRFDTILRVAQAIVERQRQFLDHGEVAMRPLVLREIADVLGLHESTISRVTTQKYMATPRGIFELKYFFGSHVGTEAGGACSATAIRALIKQMISTEEPKKPLSDSQISEVLGQQGIVVARRTIAKYRERSISRRSIYASPFRRRSHIMNLQVSGHHLEITPALRDYVTGKLERITRHFDNVIDVNVILSVDKLKQKAEVTVHLAGKDVYVESVDEDLYAAVDALVDKLERQVQKYKQKLQDHHRGNKITDHIVAE